MVSELVDMLLLAISTLRRARYRAVCLGRVRLVQDSLAPLESLQDPQQEDSSWSDSQKLQRP